MTPGAWWAQFERSRAGRAALRNFAHIRADEADRQATLARIATACYLAATYRPKDDPGAKRRAALAQARRHELASLARAARTLANAWRRDSPALLWAMTVAGTAIGPDFAPLADALDRKLPELHGGPFLHRFTVGNLHLPHAVGRGAPITATTMLAFEVVFHLRRQTAGLARAPWQSGQPMPRAGRPHYAVAALFVRAALGVRIDGRTIADRLRKLPPDTGLMPWPHEAE